MTHHSHPR